MYGSKELKSLLLKEKGGCIGRCREWLRVEKVLSLLRSASKGKGGLQAAYGECWDAVKRGGMPPEVDGCELGVGCACFFAG